MSDGTVLNSFPTRKDEALAYLYAQNQDLNGKSPEDVCKIYYNALKAISTEYHKLELEYAKAHPRKPLI